MTSHSSSEGSAFPTTQWSLVLNASADARTEARDALETLCRRYWYPLYAFARRLGRAHHEAEDCTQGFLARLLADERIAHARPERGRFRTFLLSAFRNFLINEWQRSQTLKRGSGLPDVSLDGCYAERRFEVEPAATGLTPEEAFDRSWALGLIEQVLAELQTEYEQRGHGRFFRVLSPLAWNSSDSAAAARHAAEVGMTPATFTVALHRLRRRLGERLRTRVAETVATEAEVDAELRHLIAAVSATPH